MKAERLAAGLLYKNETAALYVVALVSFMFALWAVLLISSGKAAHANPVSPVVAFTGGWEIATGVLLAAAVPAQPVVWLPRRASRWPSWLLLLALTPQQLVLLISAVGGIHAAAAGHYADGTVRPWQFIVTDQLPVILLAIIYTVAVLRLAAAWSRRRDQPR
jgi:hypothetical protein